MRNILIVVTLGFVLMLWAVGFPGCRSVHGADTVTIAEETLELAGAQEAARKDIIQIERLREWLNRHKDACDDHQADLLELCELVTLTLQRVVDAKDDTDFGTIRADVMASQGLLGFILNILRSKSVDYEEILKKGVEL